MGYQRHVTFRWTDGSWSLNRIRLALSPALMLPPHAPTPAIQCCHTLRLSSLMTFAPRKKPVHRGAKKITHQMENISMSQANRPPDAE